MHCITPSSKYNSSKELPEIHYFMLDSISSGYLVSSMKQTQPVEG